MRTWRRNNCLVRRGRPHFCSEDDRPCWSGQRAARRTREARSVRVLAGLQICRCLSTFYIDIMHCMYTPSKQRLPACPDPPSPPSLINRKRFLWTLSTGKCFRLTLVLSLFLRFAQSRHCFFSCFCSAKALLHCSILSVRLLLHSCFCSSTIPESGNFLIKPASLRGVSLMLIKVWLAKMARGKILIFFVCFVRYSWYHTLVLRSLTVERKQTTVPSTVYIFLIFISFLSPFHPSFFPSLFPFPFIVSFLVVPAVFRSFAVPCSLENVDSLGQ